MGEPRAPRRFKSRPQYVEAVQWTDSTEWGDLHDIAPHKVRLHAGDLELLAGKDGAQGWVPVPLTHWLVRQPGDPSDVWPVDADYFHAKYDLPGEVSHA